MKLQTLTYHSWADICEAICNEMQIDLETNFDRVTEAYEAEIYQGFPAPDAIQKVHAVAPTEILASTFDKNDKWTMEFIRAAYKVWNEHNITYINHAE